MGKKQVAIHGYGTIGKRVADAVSMQDDMEVIGVTKRTPNYENPFIRSKGYPLYAASEDNIHLFEDKGYPVEGDFIDLLQRADIVVDCTPGGVGAKNKEYYKDISIPAIFQGGEKHNLTGLSFNALTNYSDSFGKQFTRVVSCNTTGAARMLYPILNAYDVGNVFMVMARRAADPWDSETGPINGIQPEKSVPSHHGPDIKTVINRELKIKTMALKASTTLMHEHTAEIRFSEKMDKDDLTYIKELWEGTPRVMLVKGEDGLKSTAQLSELAKNIGRPRNDTNCVMIWEDYTSIDEDNILYLPMAVPQEDIAVPESIDAIRAVLKLEKNNIRSINKTDEAMGIVTKVA